MKHSKAQNHAGGSWKPELSPVRIAAIYTVLGFIALYVSDFFLPKHLSGQLLGQIQALKGAIEVLLTAGLIYVLTYYSERQLQQTNQRLEGFASIVSHDLRNPLNTMEGSLELAEETGDAEDFERCRQTIYQMRRLIEDLLTLAREGDIIESTAPVDVGEAAQSAWETAPTENASLSIETDLVIEADKSRVEQLFGNLYRNAVEHGGPAVTVRIGESEGGFFIADDGPGIPKGSGEAVFNAGYSTTSDGTGLGLDIVRQISEAHGWDVSAEESREGGARFEFTSVQRQR